MPRREMTTRMATSNSPLGANIYWQVQETVEDFAKAKASKADMVATNWAYSDLDNALTTDAEDAILRLPDSAELRHNDGRRLPSLLAYSAHN